MTAMTKMATSAATAAERTTAATASSSVSLKRNVTKEAMSTDQWVPNAPAAAPLPSETPATTMKLRRSGNRRKQSVSKSFAASVKPHRKPLRKDRTRARETTNNPATVKERRVIFFASTAKEVLPTTEAVAIVSRASSFAEAMAISRNKRPGKKSARNSSVRT